MLRKVTTQKPWKLASSSQRRLALATLCKCGTRTSVIILQLASVPCMKSQSAVSSKTARTQCSRIFFSARCIINRRFIWKYGLFHLISKTFSLALKIALLNEYFTVFFFFSLAHGTGYNNLPQRTPYELIEGNYVLQFLCILIRDDLSKLK